MSGPVLWVARNPDEMLLLFEHKPEWHHGGWWSPVVGEGELAVLSGDWFPDLKPGECRRMLLVDAPEAPHD